MHPRQYTPWVLGSFTSPSLCMFHATPTFYIGLETIGTLFQFLHHLSIGTTIQSHHQNHRNKNEPYNEPRSPVPTTTIQNKPQNLKTQTSQSNRRISKENWRSSSTLSNIKDVIKGGSQRRIEGLTRDSHDAYAFLFRGSQRRIEGKLGLLALIITYLPAPEDLKGELVSLPLA